MRKRPLYVANMPVSPTAFDAIYRMYHSKGAMNYGKAEQTPGLDALLERMIGATDPDERARLAREASAMLQKPSERLIPYFISAMVAASDKVEDLTLPRAYSVLDLTRVRLVP
jgi:ABC-type transport system substrate-binding protein